MSTLAMEYERGRAVEFSTPYYIDNVWWATYCVYLQERKSALTRKIIGYEEILGRKANSTPQKLLCVLGNTAHVGKERGRGISYILQLIWNFRESKVLPFATKASKNYRNIKTFSENAKK
jgi:hypothetical protein